MQRALKAISAASRPTPRGNARRRKIDYSAIGGGGVKKQDQDGGWMDNVGVKVVLGALSVLDKPASVVRSGVREGIDAVNQITGVSGTIEKRYKEDAARLMKGASPTRQKEIKKKLDAMLEELEPGFGDFKRQVGKGEGFGSLMDDYMRKGVESNKFTAPWWARTAIGLTGDVALDPLTYVTAGGAAAMNAGGKAAAKKVLSEGVERAGKAALKKAGMKHGDDIAKDFARQRMGRGAKKTGTYSVEDADAASPILEGLFGEAKVVAKKITEKGGGRSAMSAEEMMKFFGKKGGVLAKLPGTGRFGRGIVRAATGKTLQPRGAIIVPKAVTDPAMVVGRKIRGAFQELGDQTFGRIGTNPEGRKILRSGTPDQVAEELIRDSITRTAKARSSVGFRLLPGADGGSGEVASDVYMKVRKKMKKRHREVMRAIENGTVTEEEGAAELQKLFTDMRDSAVEQGVAIDNRADYIPRTMSEAGKRARAKWDDAQGHVRPQGPAEFEHARDDEAILAAFGLKPGEATNAEIREMGEQLAELRYGKIEGGYYESDLDKIVPKYYKELGRRVEEREIERALEEAGILHRRTAGEPRPRESANPRGQDPGPPNEPEGTGRQWKPVPNEPPAAPKSSPGETTFEWIPGTRGTPGKPGTPPSRSQTSEPTRIFVGHPARQVAEDGPLDSAAQQADEAAQQADEAVQQPAPPKTANPRTWAPNMEAWLQRRADMQQELETVRRQTGDASEEARILEEIAKVDVILTHLRRETWRVPDAPTAYGLEPFTNTPDSVAKWDALTDEKVDELRWAVIGRGPDDLGWKSWPRDDAKKALMREFMVHAEAMNETTTVLEQGLFIGTPDQADELFEKAIESLWNDYITKTLDDPNTPNVTRTNYARPLTEALQRKFPRGGWRTRAQKDIFPYQNDPEYRRGAPPPEPPSNPVANAKMQEVYEELRLFGESAETQADEAAQQATPPKTKNRPVTYGPQIEAWTQRRAKMQQELETFRSHSDDASEEARRLEEIAKVDETIASLRADSAKVDENWRAHDAREEAAQQAAPPLADAKTQKGTPPKSEVEAGEELFRESAEREGRYGIRPESAEDDADILDWAIATRVEENFAEAYWPTNRPNEWKLAERERVAEWARKTREEAEAEKARFSATHANDNYDVEVPVPKGWREFLDKGKVARARFKNQIDDYAGPDTWEDIPREDVYLEEAIDGTRHVDWAEAGRQRVEDFKGLVDKNGDPAELGDGLYRSTSKQSDAQRFRAKSMAMVGNADLQNPDNIEILERYGIKPTHTEVDPSEVNLEYVDRQLDTGERVTGERGERSEEDLLAQRRGQEINDRYDELEEARAEGMEEWDDLNNETPLTNEYNERFARGRQADSVMDEGEPDVEAWGVSDLDKMEYWISRLGEDWVEKNVPRLPPTVKDFEWSAFLGRAQRTVGRFSKQKTQYGKPHFPLVDDGKGGMRTPTLEEAVPRRTNAHTKGYYDDAGKWHKSELTEESDEDYVQRLVEIAEKNDEKWTKENWGKDWKRGRRLDESDSDYAIRLEEAYLKRYPGDTQGGRKLGRQYDGESVYEPIDRNNLELERQRDGQIRLEGMEGLTDEGEELRDLVDGAAPESDSYFGEADLRDTATEGSEDLPSTHWAEKMTDSALKYWDPKLGAPKPAARTIDVADYMGRGDQTRAALLEVEFWERTDELIEEYGGVGTSHSGDYEGRAANAAEEKIAYHGEKRQALAGDLDRPRTKDDVYYYATNQQKDVDLLDHDLRAPFEDQIARGNDNFDDYVRVDELRAEAPPTGEELSPELAELYARIEEENPGFLENWTPLQDGKGDTAFAARQKQMVREYVHPDAPSPVREGDALNVRPTPPDVAPPTPRQIKQDAAIARMQEARALERKPLTDLESQQDVHRRLADPNDSSYDLEAYEAGGGDKYADELTRRANHTKELLDRIDRLEDELSFIDHDLYSDPNPLDDPTSKPRFSEAEYVALKKRRDSTADALQDAQVEIGGYEEGFVDGSPPDVVRLRAEKGWDRREEDLSKIFLETQGDEFGPAPIRTEPLTEAEIENLRNQHKNLEEELAVRKRESNNQAEIEALQEAEKAAWHEWDEAAKYAHAYRFLPDEGKLDEMIAISEEQLDELEKNFDQMLLANEDGKYTVNLGAGQEQIVKTRLRIERWKGERSALQVPSTSTINAEEYMEKTGQLTVRKGELEDQLGELDYALTRHQGLNDNQANDFNEELYAENGGDTYAGELTDRINVLQDSVDEVDDALDALEAGLAASPAAEAEIGRDIAAKAAEKRGAVPRHLTMEEIEEAVRTPPVNAEKVTPAETFDSAHTLLTPDSTARQEQVQLNMFGDEPTVDPEILGQQQEAAGEALKAAKKKRAEEALAEMQQSGFEWGSPKSTGGGGGEPGFIEVVEGEATPGNVFDEGTPDIPGTPDVPGYWRTTRTVEAWEADSSLPRPEEVQEAIDNLDDTTAEAIDIQLRSKKATEAADSLYDSEAVGDEALKRLRAPIGKRIFGQTLRDGMEVLQRNKDLAGPRDVVNIMNKLEAVSKDPGKFLRGYDMLLHNLVSWQLASPGFHVRNYFGGYFNNYLADVDAGAHTRFIRDWRRYEKGTLKDPEKVRIFSELMPRLQGGQFTGEAIGGTIRTMDSAVSRSVGRNNPWLRANRGFGANVETVLRGTLGYDRMLKGAYLDEALADITTFHFDYQDLSHFEQNVVKRIVPFYTWTRRNLPLQVEMALQSPGKYANMERARRTLEERGVPEKVVPAFYQDLFAIPIGTGKAGTKKGQGYVTPDLPFLRTVASVFPDLKGGSPLGVAAPWLAQVTPLIKAPIEVARGAQVFKGTPFRGTAFRKVGGGANAKYEPNPAYMDIPGLTGAMKALQLTDDKGRVTDTGQYLTEQLFPAAGRVRRLFPRAERDRLRSKTSRAQFLGLPFRENTKYERQIEVFRRMQAQK